MGKCLIHQAEDALAGTEQVADAPVVKVDVAVLDAVQTGHPAGELPGRLHVAVPEIPGPDTLQVQEIVMPLKLLIEDEEFPGFLHRNQGVVAVDVAQTQGTDVFLHPGRGLVLEHEGWPPGPSRTGGRTCPPS